MGITTNSVEHFVLSIYIVFLIVDIAAAYKNKVRLRNEYSIDRSYLRLFAKEHAWTVVALIGFYVIFSIFF